MVANDHDDTVKEEYALLKEEFAEIIQKGIEEFQDKLPGRQIENITLRLQGRYGFVAQTNKDGLFEITEISGQETNNQGQDRKQRMVIGLNCTVSTKQDAFNSVSLLKKGDTIIQEFEANTTARELLKHTVLKAQSAGETYQYKIDEESKQYWPCYQTNQYLNNSISWDTRDYPSIDTVLELMAVAKRTLKTELKAKLAECKVIFFHVIDTMELADSYGTKLDTVIPRTGISILAKTTRGNEVYEAIRGTGCMDAIIRHNKLKTYTQTVEDLAKEIALQCLDLDRAQSCSAVGNNAYVLLSGECSGVLGHEIYGHLSELDTILLNAHNNSSIDLKSRIGGQIVDNNEFNVIDDGNFDITLGDKRISNCYGAIITDDNGSPPQRTALITNGIQTGVMNSSRSLNELLDSLHGDVKINIKQHGLSGNVRNERYDKEPIIRMTNTFVLPNPNGANTLQEMAEKIPRSKKGIYLKTCYGGWVDSDTGQFGIACQLGYLIENGAITNKPVKDILIEGHISKFGSKIKEIGTSETIKIWSSWCFKDSQWTPIESGGPALLIENVAIKDEKKDWSWHDDFTEYKRQMLEVLHKKRKKSEVFLRFLNTSKTTNHSTVCMLSKHLSHDDEIQLLSGRSINTSNYILNSSGKLEGK